MPVTPCRLFDTRPDQNIPDSDTTPIAQAPIRDQQVTGEVGNCDIPAGISGVAMNVTIVNPTADSFLTLFPADETTLPVGSNLNWTAGQSPTANKVDVKLSPDGMVKIYNNTGTVTAPTAPVGKVCVYSDTLSNVDGALGRGLTALDGTGFAVFALTDGAVGDQARLGFTWAYTAP